MLNFIYQGSEIETVVYVVGLPYYQNCQHVYTAVTRGIRQVIIIYHPSHLQRAIATPPDKRQTKLKEDLSDKLEYGMICWSDEGDDCLDDGSGITVQDSGGSEEAPACSVTECNSKTEEQSSGEDLVCWSDEGDDCLDDGSGITAQDSGGSEVTPACSVTECNSKTEEQSSGEDLVCWSDEDDDCLDDGSGITAQDSGGSEVTPACSVTECNSKTEERSSGESCTGEQNHPSTTELSNDFCISRKNLRLKKMKQDQEQQRGTTVSSTANYISVESHQQLLQTANPIRVGDFQSPGQKRKYPELMNAQDFLTPPQTPPSLKNLPSSLSCVSPLGQRSSQTPEAVVSQPSSSPRKQAEYPSWCRVCRRSVHKGDDITYFYEGSIKRWIHLGCKQRV